ncbi:MAG: DUF4390 domain-containing protein [Thermoanaerobaculia bacterium]
MLRSRVFRPAFVALLFLFASSAVFAEADAYIDHLSASAKNGRVSVRFTLENGFERAELQKALQSGLPTGFTYHITLLRQRPNWFDSTVGETEIQVVVTFNSVTREYLLNYRRDHKLVRSETLTDLAALRQRMTSIDEHDLFDLGGRRPWKHVVRVRADVARGFLLSMIPVDISTRWRETRVAEAHGSR